MVLVLFLRLVLGREGVVLGVGIQMVVAGRFLALDIVPPVAGEFLLIEQRTVGAEEGRALVSLAPIVAGVVGLAAGFDVRVHAGDGGHVATVEAGVRHLVVDRIVDTGHAGNFAKVLLVLLLVVWRVQLVLWIVQRTVVVHFDALDGTEQQPHGGNGDEL